MSNFLSAANGQSLDYEEIVKNSDKPAPIQNSKALSDNLDKQFSNNFIL